jgi:hypothetical protein
MSHLLASGPSSFFYFALPNLQGRTLKRPTNPVCTELDLYDHHNMHEARVQK